MRHTEIGEAVLAGRSSERPAPSPEAFLFRAHAGDGEDCILAFDRRSVVFSRPVAGLACKIRLSIRQYDAIAVVAEADRNTVRLFHRDPGLSVDIAEIETFAEAEACRDRFADMLGLPTLTMGRGARKANHAAQSEAEPARTRRADRTVRARRARFLTRRASGAVSPIRRLQAQEIIARS